MAIPLLSELVSATVEGIVADVATIRNAASITALSNAVAPFTATTYGPTAIASSGGEAWTTGVLTLAAPATAASVYDYVVRAHGYPTSTPTVGYVDESVVIRVSRNSGGTAAVIMGHNKPFNSPKLRATLNASTVTIDVRADAADGWTWTLSQLRMLAPFDGQYKSAVAAQIGTGSSWITLVTIPGPVKNGDQMDVAYAVRGRFNTSGSAWSFIRGRGVIAVAKTGDTVAIADATAVTWSDARVRATVSGSDVLIQVQQHATNNWYFSAEATATKEAI
jgi:hypothetical protein